MSRHDIAGIGVLLVFHRGLWGQIIILRRLIATRILVRRRMSHSSGLRVFQFFFDVTVNWWRQVALTRGKSKYKTS